MIRAAIFSVILAACASAQEPAFKADISLVEIDALVIGRTGVVEGLQRGDFAVRDNRKPVSLRYVSQETAPLDIVLLFETSKLMGKKLNQLTVAAELAMAEFRERDRVAIMSFNEDIRVELPFTADLKEAKRRIRIGLQDAAFGMNPFVLAAADGAEKYLAAQPEPHQRRVVLMFTGDAGFGMKKENHMAVAKALWNDDAFLSAVVIPNGLTRVTHDDNPQHFQSLQLLSFLAGFSLYDFVDDVAEQTGGEVVYPGTPLRPMIERMRKRYKLYYDRPAGKPGERRQVQVTLGPATQALHPDARIVARKGYVSPK
jgi:VWFA-related protein